MWYGVTRYSFVSADKQCKSHCRMEPDENGPWIYVHDVSRILKALRELIEDDWKEYLETLDEEEL